MLFITKEEDLDLSSDKNSLYFFGRWMPYHKKMLVMLDKMEDRHDDVKFYAIDVDMFKGMCKRFSVDSVPTVLILNGNKKKRIIGTILTSAIRAAFDDICSK